MLTWKFRLTTQGAFEGIDLTLSAHQDTHSIYILSLAGSDV